MEIKYITAEDVSESELEEGLSSGTIIAWRIDSAGTAWYRRVGVILGIPEAENEND